MQQIYLERRTDCYVNILTAFVIDQRFILNLEISITIALHFTKLSVELLIKELYKNVMLFL